VWRKWIKNDVGDGAEYLVRRFSGLDIGALDLDRIPPDVGKILLVDGLNEITSPVGGEVLHALDELVRDQIQMSALVADRLIRRELPNPTRWSIGSPLPLSEEQVRRHLGGVGKVDEILRCPFFLDAALRFNVKGRRRSLASQRFLTEHGGIQERDLSKVAAAAFEAYQRAKSRVFDRAAFARVAGEAPTHTLELSSTLLSKEDGSSYFAHHILHDYLAARHVSSWPTEDWTPEALAVLSFESRSFDAVELVFELLDGERADQFLRRLYDWNLYAAGYALAQAQDSDANVSAEVRTMIFAMLAEKRLDPILATRQRANDALALMQLSDAAPFREAKSLDEVFAALNSVSSIEDWFVRWRSLFQVMRHESLGVDTLASIRSADSISGWTIANVAKRTVLQDEAREALARWVRDEHNSTVRWRIAHTLGACQIPDAFNALIRLLDSDPDSYVRYGAIRSIIEKAALGGANLRGEIAGAIGVRAEAIDSQPKILGELRASLLMDPNTVPRDWLGFVTSVVRAMFLATDKTNERDLWRQCLSKAEELYLLRADPSPQEAGVRDG
jgi:hypothetical protein